VSSTNPDPKSNHVSLNRANPGHLPDLLRVLPLGDVLAGNLIHQKRKQTPAAQTNELATLEGLGLPYTQRAAFILRATSRVASAGGPGELAVKLFAVTPTAGEVAVSPSGDIVVLAADVQRGLDVVYVPAAGEVVDLVDQPAPAGVLTLPTAISNRGVIYLLEATATAASLTGRKGILAPATTNTATTKAALSVDGTRVYFNSGTDAVTRATVKLLVAPALGLSEQLLADATTI
jgi:hypothetical protein